jgi:hypothetical protein
MDPALERESEKLARSWMKHDSAWLRDYLVAGVEDPRVNLQSILSRHFLVRALAGDGFSLLMEQEYRFAAAMNWLLALAQKADGEEQCAAVLHGLRRGADNAEGVEIPRWVLRSFAGLPAHAGDLQVPNYIEGFLVGARFEQGLDKPHHQACLDTFRGLWAAALLQVKADASLTVLEPACGSANDYRSLHAYRLASLLDYTGLDLCEKNIENARALFPNARFQLGNVFDIAAADKSFEVCLVHDLFEHLSPDGLQAAVKEVCRVTRRGICVGFFQMDETIDHVVRPMDEYHLNTLSMDRMKGLFARGGFAAQVIHVETFLNEHTGCGQTHNPNAYTFVLQPV